MQLNLKSFCVDVVHTQGRNFAGPCSNSRPMLRHRAFTSLLKRSNCWRGQVTMSQATPQHAAGSAPTAKSAIDFLLLLQKLKVRMCSSGKHMGVGATGKAPLTFLHSCLVQQTKRTGWVRKGVQGPESIAGVHGCQWAPGSGAQTLLLPCRCRGSAVLTRQTLIALPAARWPEAPAPC